MGRVDYHDPLTVIYAIKIHGKKVLATFIHTFDMTVVNAWMHKAHNNSDALNLKEFRRISNNGISKNVCEQNKRQAWDLKILKTF